MEIMLRLRRVAWWVAVPALGAVLLSSCGKAQAINIPTCCDQAVRVPAALPVSGTLLITGGGADSPVARPVPHGIVTFRKKTGLGYSEMSVRTSKAGTFRVLLAPGTYAVHAASGTTLGNPQASFGSVRVGPRAQKTLRLVLAAL